MDVGTIRVHAPTTLIFTCGGTLDVSTPAPPSLREAFLRAAHDDKFYDKYHIVIAEDLNPFFPNGNYTDILQLESDIAQISELVLLFSESYGSASELGAFSMLPEIASRLLVAIDDKNYNDASFISLGPLLALQRRYGERSVCVLNRGDIGISNILNVAGLRSDVFADVIKSAIVERSKDFQTHSTFDQERDGHLIKLVVGIVQHHGSLLLDEIETYLFCLDVPISRTRIEDLLLCAEFAKWIVKDRRGLKTYYSASATNSAMSFKLKPGVPPIARVRWHALIREYWEANDPTRFNSIQDAMAKAV